MNNKDEYNLYVIISDLNQYWTGCDWDINLRNVKTYLTHDQAEIVRNTWKTICPNNYNRSRVVSLYSEAVRLVKGL